MIVKAGILTDCTHCGLPVPSGLMNYHRIEQFCCSGCEGAYELIHGNGLDSFYRMAETDSENRTLQAKSVARSRFAEYDEPVFQQKYAKTIGTGATQIELALEGMHCGACIWLIEKLPRILDGVSDARIHWGRRTVTVTWLANQVSLSKIAATLNQLGYRPSPIQQDTNSSRWRLENHKHLIRIGTAAACAGNNMMISAALYFGMFSHMTAGMTQLMRVSSALIGLVALLWPGRAFLTSAFAALRTRTPHMDLPIALALIVGTGAGLWNVMRGSGEIYFDSLSVLIFLLLVGRWFQFRQQTKAASSIALMNQLTPQTTVKLVDGEPVEQLVDLIKANDVLLIRQGDLFPADGVIVDSVTDVNEAILTGESVTVRKQLGDRVYAGTTNVGSAVKVEVRKTGSETRIGGLVELVERASQDKPAMVLWANRIGGYFVVAVTALASLTFLWWVGHETEIAVERAVALLVVACPCALALATPLTIAVALSRAARRKVMIKGGDALQSLKNPGTIWLDKTGTLTDGQVKVARWYGDVRWLTLAAVLEESFSHPIANAIVEFQKRQLQELGSEQCLLHQTENPDTLPGVADLHSHQGLGVSGMVGSSRVFLGSRKFIENQNLSFSRAHCRIADRITRSGGSPCWVAVDFRVVGVADLRDSVRPDAKFAIDTLRNRGWRVGILSGDHQEVVDRVAQTLGIESDYAIGGADPEKKLALVKENEQSVVMIGDGVNDSAALAAADVGIAVKNSAEASLTAAPVYFAKPGLAPVLELFAISDSMARTMRINLAVSLTYNMTFAGLAFLGYINPLVAAILMPVSSLTVVALSLNSGRTNQSFY